MSLLEQKLKLMERMIEYRMVYGLDFFDLIYEEMLIRILIHKLEEALKCVD